MKKDSILNKKREQTITEKKTYTKRMKGNKVFIQPQVSQIYKINCLQKINEKEGIAYKQKNIFTSKKFIHH